MNGLYEKYSVEMDGEPQDGCFVLKPENDEAARRALEAYANETNDQKLANQLRGWVEAIETEENT